MFPITIYLKDRWISMPFVMAVAFLIFTIWHTALKVQPTSEPVFLHYNIIFGVDLIGEWWKLWFIPLSGLVIFVLNYGLSYFLYNKDKFLSRFLSIITALLEALIISGSILIIGINV